MVSAATARLTVREFEASRHADAAAALLAARHSRDRARDPRLPARFEHPAECRTLIEGVGSHPGEEAVVVARGDEIVGFAAMAPFIFNPTDMTAAFFAPRTAQIGLSHHAAARGMEYDVYRELYAALCGRLIQRGYFDHIVYIPASDDGVHDALASLGFGAALTAGVRDVAPAEAPRAASVEIHMAGAEDIDVVMQLNDELYRHHAAAPIFWAHPHETDAAMRQFQAGLLEEPDRNAHFIAYDAGKAVGMQTFMAPDWIGPMVQPERTVYLYQGIVSADARRGGVGAALLAKGVEWARDQGYEHIALHYATPNISGARFWQSTGFGAVEYRMARHVDERIAWANV